jgi:BirA family biotin operon repressor/biotin-[acetyl-CoA-carboxylase] ligase
MQSVIKIFHKRLNSTNLFANQYAEEHAPGNPVWIRTDDQFEGRGQGDHTWISEAGLNLTGSFLLYPDKLSGSDQFCLSMVASLASADFLELFLEDVRIKWPNDLYVNKKKIGGILIETSVMGTMINQAVIGVGINVNQVRFDDNLPNPVSIRQITSFEYDIREIEDLFIDCFLSWYRLIDSENKSDLKDAYLKKLFRFKEFAPYKTDGKWFRARILDVNQYGHLVLENELGQKREYAFQEVEFIR